MVLYSPELGTEDRRRRTTLAQNYSSQRPVPQIESYWKDLTIPEDSKNEAQVQDEGETATENDGNIGAQGQSYLRNRRRGDGAASNSNGRSSDKAQHARNDSLSASPSSTDDEFQGALNKDQSEKRRKRDLHRGSTRVVTDAITFRKVRIKNTDADIDSAIDPRRSRGARTLTRAFPPVDWDRAIEGYRSRMIRYTGLALVPALIVPKLVGFWWGSTLVLVWVAALGFHFNRVGTSTWLDEKWDLERRRGRSHIDEQKMSRGGSSAASTGSGRDGGDGCSGAGGPGRGRGRRGRKEELELVGGDEAGIQDKRESVEWMNTVLGGLWPIIDPKLFVSVVDLLEDVMQASIPSFIQTVRIKDLSQGNHPIRIISIRTLPEDERDRVQGDRDRDGSGNVRKDDSREEDGEEVEGGLAGLMAMLKKDTSDPFVRGESPGPLKTQRSSSGPKTNGYKGHDRMNDYAPTDEQDDDDEENEGSKGRGKFVNLEIAFAYRALPVQGKKVYSKAKNAHLIIDFGLGIPGVLGGAFPVWVELRGIVGTMRLRIELVAEPPFVKHATISFMGLPKVEISAIPMIETGFKLNAMNLPLVSTFISNSVNTAIDEYVAPKSLTVDLGQLLVGDDIKKDTLSIGVIVVTIHKAVVQAADMAGKSDPYVTASFAKYGKPLFSTRIIKNETEPCWRASTMVLVKADAFKVNEKFALQIWDSDRLSADDELGRVEVDLYDLHRHSGKMRYHQSHLKHSIREKKSMPGEIHYSIGYFPKVKPDGERQQDSNKDSNLPTDFQDKDEMRKESPKTMDKEEDRIIAMIPSDKYPSGILSIQVHEAFDLERQYIGPSQGGDRSEKGRFSHPKGTEDAQREEGDDLPSAYFRIRVNDETTYQSRVKPIQSQPFFQAGQERFIRDWRSTLIQIIMRDSRVRESDPMLGMLHLNLRDVFRDGSQLTKTYPLVGGIGYGRVRVSLLFRPVDIKLPRSLLGWEIASAIVRGPIRLDIESSHQSKFSHCSVSLRTSHGSNTIRHHNHHPGSDAGNAIEWQNERMSLPIKKRFASPLVVSFESNGLHLKGGTIGMGVLWLMTVEDSERHRIRLPIYETKDYKRLEQNFWTYHETSNVREKQPNSEHFANDSSAFPDPESYGLTRIGTVSFELLILPGISSNHRKVFKKEPRGRIILEGFDNAVRAGLREDLESPDQVEKEAETYPWSGDENNNGESNGMKPGVERKAHRHKEAQVDRTRAGGNETDASVVTFADEQVDGGDDSDESTTSSTRRTSHTRTVSSGSRGLKDHYREWKETQTDLHSKHRGFAQAKAYRSAKWIKDSAVSGLVKAKHKFEMHERNPDIESEV